MEVESGGGVLWVRLLRRLPPALRGMAGERGGERGEGRGVRGEVVGEKNGRVRVMSPLSFPPRCRVGRNERRNALRHRRREGQ